MIFIRNKKPQDTKNTNTEVEERINTYRKSITNKKTNARFFQRFSLLEDNVTILYNNDILRIHDISYNGFSVKVSPYSLKNYILGKTYCFKKLKLIKQETTIYAKVIWISEERSEIGFSIEDSTNASTRDQIEQLILPWEISYSLKPVDLIDSTDTINTESKEDKVLIYKGLLNTELSIILDRKEQLKSFQIFSNNFYLQWKDNELSTGTFSYRLEEDSTTNQHNVKTIDNNIIYIDNNLTTKNTPPRKKEIPFLLSSGNIILTPDKNINTIHKLFLYTILKKSSIPNKDLVLKILE